MKAFTDTPITKEQFVAQLKWHQEQDAFIKGTYGQDSDKDHFKACAVGCSINSINLELGKKLEENNHKNYEEYLGVPEWLAQLEDTLFEGLPLSRVKTWPVEFGEAIKVGAELDKIKVPFIVYILEQNLITLDSLKVDREKFKDVFDAIEQIKAATKQMVEAKLIGNQEAINSAESAALSAESAAWSAAWSAAESAKSAAESAALSAESAAWSAESAKSAAESAAWSAAWSAAKSARTAAYIKYADKLLELMRGCE